MKNGAYCLPLFGGRVGGAGFRVVKVRQVKKPFFGGGRVAGGCGI
jgi:hypothetical protein